MGAESLLGFHSFFVSWVLLGGGAQLRLALKLSFFCLRLSGYRDCRPGLSVC